MSWYWEQVEWSGEHDYDHPAVSSPALRNWFMEIKNTFPPMNGPYAPSDAVPDRMEEEEDERVTDYSIGKEVIYAVFAWSVADDAFTVMKALAQKHGVGFFDVSSDDGEILFPDGAAI